MPIFREINDQQHQDTGAYQTTAFYLDFADTEPPPRPSEHQLLCQAWHRAEVLSRPRREHLARLGDPAYRDQLAQRFYPAADQAEIDCII